MDNNHYFNQKRNCLEDKDFFQNSTIVAQKVITEKISFSYTAEGFLALNKSSLLCAFDSILSKKDTKLSFNYLTKCNQYNILALSLIKNAEAKQFSFDKEDILFSMGLLFLLNEEKDFMDFFTTYMHKQDKNSFSSKDIIILLISKSLDNSILNVNDTYQSLYVPHMNMLKNLKSKDTAKINVLIYIICEMYLKLENKKKNSFQNINYAFPYEVLTWLKLRERKGLKNPTKFTHPLMNTPIAKMFLDIKEPLPKPKELPYAKELLEKLKEKRGQATFIHKSQPHFKFICTS